MGPMSIDQARRLFDMAKHPKSFVSLDTANHLLSDERDARYAGDVLAAWSTRYLEGVQPDVETDPEIGKQGEVVVTGGSANFCSTLRVEMRIPQMRVQHY